MLLFSYMYAAPAAFDSVKVFEQYNILKILITQQMKDLRIFVSISSGGNASFKAALLFLALFCGKSCDTFKIFLW